MDGQANIHFQYFTIGRIYQDIKYFEPEASSYGKDIAMPVRIDTTCRPATPHRRRPSIPDLVALWRQRRRLATLDDHLLDDIGVTRGEAETEARRPVWDAPRTWRA